MALALAVASAGCGRAGAALEGHLQGWVDWMGRVHRGTSGGRVVLAGQTGRVVLSPTRVRLARLGGGEEKWHPPVLVFLEKCPVGLCPSSTCSEITQ